MTAPSVTWRAARKMPPLREPLLYAWRHGWLPAPSGDERSILGDGRVLHCSLGDHTQRRMALDRFEPAETSLFRALVRPGDVVIDVGAHIGWFSTLAGRLVAPGGQVLAFEAFPGNFELLQRNLADNAVTTVQPRPTAVGAAAGTLQIGRQSGSDSGSVTAVARDRQSLVDVPVTTLDAAATHVDRIRLLKVDVEGFEAQVLAGASATLARTEFVMFELNRSALTAAGTSPREILEVVAGHGFDTMWVLLDSGVRRLRRAPTWLVNVLACRGTSALPDTARRSARLRRVDAADLGATLHRRSGALYLHGPTARFAPTLSHGASP